MFLMAQQELIRVGGFPPLKRLLLPSCCLEMETRKILVFVATSVVCGALNGIDQSAGMKRVPSHTDDDHELNVTLLMVDY